MSLCTCVGMTLPKMRVFLPVIKKELRVSTPPQHKRRRWMKDAYHNRVQKKWDYRFGILTYVPTGPVMTLQMSEATFNKIKEKIDGRKQ